MLSQQNTSSVLLEPATEAIEPFRVTIHQSSLDDLKRRLTQTRWPNSQTVSDWSQGVPLLKARALVEHWRDSYDWRPFETKLNSFPQFRTQIDGCGRGRILRLWRRDIRQSRPNRQYFKRISARLFHQRGGLASPARAAL
jgi:hypothetical protein